MKNIISFLIFAIALNSCNKDNDPKPTNPIDQLPPATQTGANTFGCLLDGEVFKPSTIPGNRLDCVYQYVDGGYYFSLQANRRDPNNNLIALGCSTQNLQIFEGQTYQLKDRIDGNAYGKYFLNIEFTYTNTFENGELKITKLDSINNIVSGTFWFNISDFLGNKHEIREGRFDIQFTN